MDSLEIPRLELMNYLPYFLIEEALEFTLTDLVVKSQGQPRVESRIKSYLPDKQTQPKGQLQSLITSFDFEKEVSDEIKKIMHSQMLYDVLIASMIFDQTQSEIKNLLQDSNFPEFIPSFNY